MQYKNFQKIKNNKVYSNPEARRGFVILFAVTIASAILAVSLGIANIALKELRFSTSAREANNAFLAADTGAELALFNDKPSPTSAYPAPAPGASQTWTFNITGLNGTSCAKVSVQKDNINSSVQTTIISKGYNIGDASCNSTNPSRVERELRITNNVAVAPPFICSSPPVPSLVNVIWTNTNNVSVSGNTITKNSGADTTWNAGAASIQSISCGDGYTEFSTNEINTYKYFGLGDGSQGDSPPGIRYVMYAQGSGNTLAIYEQGVNKSVLCGGVLCSYNPGDVFRISVVSGVVRYYQNGNLLYTSSLAPVYPLKLSGSIYNIGGTLSNAKITAN